MAGGHLPEFTLKNLILLEWRGSHIKLVDEICVDWQQVAMMLGMPQHQLEAIMLNYLGNVRECMIDVLRLWLKGRYNYSYPPTWEGLMALLRGRHYSALAERLENVLYSISSGEVPAPQGFGPSVATSLQDQHREACSRIIKDKLSLTISIVRFVYLGLPRSGKTCLRRRLMGDILNILMAMKKKVEEKKAMEERVKEEPSTGVVEEAGMVIVKNFIHSSTGTISMEGGWSAVKDLLEETGMLNQLFLQTANRKPPSDKVGKTANQKPPLSKEPTKRRDSSIITKEKVEEMFSAFQEAMAVKDWDRVKYDLDNITLLINTDTGGQAEFLEMHAALVTGPSLYLLFWKLIDQFDKEYKMHYTNDKGVSTEEEYSTTTVEEVLFQALASIACFSNTFDSKDENNTSSAARVEANTPQGKVNYSKSKALFVGTYLDELTDEQQLRDKQQFVRSRIECTDFYKERMIAYASPNNPILGVNNYSGGQDELDDIRAVLKRIIENYFDKITIPAAWLMLSIYIRKKDVPTMSLMDCEELAGKLGIDQEELQEALWFLHHCVGILLYYPELDVLKDTVICDIQVVFNSVTELVKNTFTFEKVGNQAAEEFRDKAQFSRDDLLKAIRVRGRAGATASSEDKLIPLEKLVELLKHLNLLTPKYSSQNVASAQATPTVVYFMPSILRSASKDYLVVPTSDRDPVSLIMHYDCGYVPLGLFTSMLTNIVSQQLHGWDMDEDQLKKNVIKFFVCLRDDFDEVTLIGRPRYIEVVISREKDKEEYSVPTKSLCAHVRGVVQCSLKTVTSRLNSHLKKGYKFAFECTSTKHGHSEKGHLCILGKETDRFVTCVYLKKKNRIRLQDHHLVWFEEKLPPDVSNYIDGVSDSLPSHTSDRVLYGVPTEKKLLLIRWRCRDSVEPLEFRLLNKICNCCHTIGTLLEIDRGILTCWEREVKDPIERTMKVFSKWIEKSGTQDYPLSWDGIRLLLDAIDYGQTAKELLEALEHECT